MTIGVGLTIFCLRCLRIVVGEKPHSCGLAALVEVDGEVLADNKLNTTYYLLHFVSGLEEVFLQIALDVLKIALTSIVLQCLQSFSS
jgi:hypothetical protein